MICGKTYTETNIEHHAVSSKNEEFRWKICLIVVAMAVKWSTIDILLPLNENYLKSSLAEINDPHTKPLLTALIDELCTRPLDVLHHCHWSISGSQS